MTAIIYCYGDGTPMIFGLDNITAADRQAILLRLQMTNKQTPGIIVGKAQK